jgi:hypothetical protein
MSSKSQKNKLRKLAVVISCGALLTSLSACAPQPPFDGKCEVLSGPIFKSFSALMKVGASPFSNSDVNAKQQAVWGNDYTNIDEWASEVDYYRDFLGTLDLSKLSQSELELVKPLLDESKVTGAYLNSDTGWYDLTYKNLAEIGSICDAEVSK